MHSLLSPSKAARWIQCPGSLKLESLFPEESNDAADEGKLAHEYCANVLLNQENISVSPEMERYCQVYIDYINSLRDEGDFSAIENLVKMDSIHPDMFGTVDAVISRRLYDSESYETHIIDFKYGFSPVEVKENWQLICYAIGWIDLYENNGLDTESITLTIVQPRAYHKEGIIRHWKITIEQLNKYRELLRQHAETAMTPGAPFKAGDHCKYCKARASCQELSSTVLNNAKSATSKQEFKSIGDELRYLKKCNKMISDRIDVLSFDIISRLQQGVVIPGFELKNGLSRRRWAVDKSVIEELGDENGIDLLTVVSPAEAEKLGLCREIIDDLTIRDKGCYRLEEV